MDILAIVEVAIGIVFIWFLTSMLASTLYELILSYFSFRAKNLENAIHQMLIDPLQQKKFTSWVSYWLLSRPVKKEAGVGKVFYEHPVIKSLGLKDGRFPSYIPSWRFADVVFDMVIEAGTPESPLDEIAQTANTILKNIEDKDKAILMYEDVLEFVNKAIKDARVDAYVLKAFDKKQVALLTEYPQLKPATTALQNLLEAAPADAKEELKRNLKNGVIKLAAGNDGLKKTLNMYITRAITTAQDTDEGLAAARKNLESWFDDTMARLSGVYKRWAQVWALVIGLLAAVVFNIDSLTIVQVLWTNPSVRQVVVASAEKQYNTLLETTPTSAATEISPTTPTPEITPSPEAGATSTIADEELLQKIATQKAAADATVATLQSLSLPIGWVWKGDGCGTKYVHFFERTTVQDVVLQNDPQISELLEAKECLTTPQKTSWLQWLLGVLVTALATTQGTPFWFEILGKLVNLRSTIKPPTSAEAEAAKKKDGQGATPK